MFTSLAFTRKNRFCWLGPSVFTTQEWLRYFDAGSLPLKVADIVRLLVRSSAFPKEQSTANWFASVMKVHRQTRNRKGTKIVLTATASVET